MNWRLEFAPEVEKDVAEAANWYETRQSGLGAQFVEEIIRVWDAFGESTSQLPPSFDQEHSMALPGSFSLSHHI
jgi:hypothetical protein